MSGILQFSVIIIGEPLKVFLIPGSNFSGHALWTVPTGTALLLLIGVGVESSFMFAIAGLVLSKLLPADPNLKNLGIPNRLLFAIGNAAFFSIVEIFLVKTPAFAWVYPL